MSLDSDIIVDRRRIRPQADVLARGGRGGSDLGVVAIGPDRDAGQPRHADGVGLDRARQNRRADPQRPERVEALERLEKSPAAAVIVHINSPGGTTAGSEQLYDSLVRLKAKKPLVVVVEGLAASGGYITAIAADHIMAQQSSLVGSIGVLFQFPNVTELLKTVGVKVEEMKSSPLKAAPNGYEPTSPEARAAIDALVKDSYAWFRGLVKERRGMDDTQLEKVADGRVFTGRQAVDFKLIDELGDEKTAVAWLVAAEDVKKRPARARLQAAAALRRSAVPANGGVDHAGRARPGRHCAPYRAGRRRQAVDRLAMDGMLALWQPAPRIDRRWGASGASPALRVVSQARFRAIVTHFGLPKFDLAS